jgi:hypothetical protein
MREQELMMVLKVLAQPLALREWEMSMERSE